MTGVALITGGQRGIGLGIATALAGAGYRIALAAEVAEDDPQVTSALSALPADSAYLRHDLRNIDAAPGLVEAVEAKFGPITTFVSNAGVPSPTRGDLLKIAPQDYDFVQEINLRGAFFLAQAVARRFAETSEEAYRSLIFVTSVSADIASKERAAYCISKAGLSMVAKLFADRLAETGTGVFEVRPGIITTEMTAGVSDRYDSLIEDGLVPARRWGEPADIGRAIVPLVTGQMSFATGTVIPVDGGLSIPRL